MRSLLVQASSVEKAVEKAWADAGMPTEFTIKILEFGEKGFFGITKKAAIVSILYPPQKQTALAKKQGKPVRQARPTRRPGQRIDRPAPIRSMAPQENTAPPVQKIFWTEPMLADITTWLKELTKNMQIDTPFTMQSNRKMAKVIFDGYVLETQEEERLLFSGFSYLLMQFLKKTNKKKYQGYQLILTSKRFAKPQEKK